MPTTMRCTECDALLALKATTVAGAKVRCPKCGAINVVEGPSENEPPARKEASKIKSSLSVPRSRPKPTEDDEPPTRKKSGAVTASSSARRRRDEDEDTGSQASRRSVSRDDEDDARPQSRKRAVDFRGAFTVASANVSVRVPLTVSYKLVEGAERDRILNPPPPPKEVPKLLSDPEITRILADLRGKDRGRYNPALQKLIKAIPTAARRAEVAQVLEPILSDTDGWVCGYGIQAIAVWDSKANTPALIKLLTVQNPWNRADAMKALAKLQDPAAAEPIAKRLLDFPDRGAASTALQTLGSPAQKAVLPYLKNPDWGVRLEACRILKAIGTKECKSDWEAVATDSNGLVAGEAKAALAAVTARPWPGRGWKPKPSSLTSLLAVATPQRVLPAHPGAQHLGSGPDRPEPEYPWDRPRSIPSETMISINALHLTGPA